MAQDLSTLNDKQKSKLALYITTCEKSQKDLTDTIDALKDARKEAHKTDASLVTLVAMASLGMGILIGSANKH